MKCVLILTLIYYLKYFEVYRVRVGHIYLALISFISFNVKVMIFCLRSRS